MIQRKWIWIGESVALAVHDMQLAEHGGLNGVRDKNLLESALAKPRNQEVYGTPDVAELAASYAFGLARNHPFVDGNKRTAFVVCELFLNLNGWVLAANDVDCVLTMQALAAGEISELKFADWIRSNSTAKK